MQTKKSDNRLQTVVRLSWRLRITLAFRFFDMPIEWVMFAFDSYNRMNDTAHTTCANKKVG